MCLRPTCRPANSRNCGRSMARRELARWYETHTPPSPALHPAGEPMVERGRGSLGASGLDPGELRTRSLGAHVSVPPASGPGTSCCWRRWWWRWRWWCGGGGVTDRELTVGDRWHDGVAHSHARRVSPDPHRSRWCHAASTAATDHTGQDGHRRGRGSHQRQADPGPGSQRTQTPAQRQ